MTVRRVLSLWGPVAAVVALLYLASSQPGSTIPLRFWDKPIHAGAYALLGALALRACHGGILRLRPGATAAAALLTVGHGIFDEIHQSFVPGRDSSVGDVVADAVGMAIALALLHAWTRRRDAAL